MRNSQAKRRVSVTPRERPPKRVPKVTTRTIRDGIRSGAIDLTYRDLSLTGKAAGRGAALKQVAKSLRPFMGLAKYARLHPALIGAAVAYDLWDLYRQQGQNQAAGWVFPQGGYRDNVGSECGTVDKWLTSGNWPNPNTQCGTLRVGITNATWNAPEGPTFISYYPSGDIRYIDWQGYEFKEKAVTGIRAYRRVYLRQRFDSPGLPSGTPISLPEYQAAIATPPVFIAAPEANFTPSLDPELIPIGVPRGTPKPVPFDLVPHRQPNPYRHPDYQWVGGYGAPAPRPTLRPEWRPDIEIQSSGSNLTVASSASSSGHRLQPPGRNTKERKVRATGSLLKVFPLIDAVTETVDFVDALYDALPSEFKPRYKDTRYEKLSAKPQEKLAALYAGLEHIDIRTALQNLVIEHYEDKFWGKLGEINAEASRRAGLPTKIGFESYTSELKKSVFDYQRSQNREIKF